MDINYHQHTLNNGLRIVHKPSNSNVAYCGFFINAGTRDEKPSEYGMAHFVEHMLFKGTKKRKAHHIINRMEAVGGELNAFTNKEETVVYSAFLAEHYERALELLTDLVFNSQFPGQEVDKEREVIIDEIHSYEDSPSELIFDDFEDLVFKDMEIGHNILGTEQHLLSFDTEMAKAFVERYYKPSNMVLFSQGRMKFDHVIKFAEKYTDHVSNQSIVSVRKQTKQNLSSALVLKRDTSQVHALIGGQSYSLKDKNRKVLSLLNNILGGPGMNSRLNVSLREKRGYVYTVESSATAYSDTGLFSVYFGCDIKNENKCIDLVYKELKKIRENKLTASQLHAAKKQYIGQLGVASANLENIALSLGKSYFHFEHFDSLTEIERKINAITAEQINQVANEILAEEQLFKLIYH